MPGPYVEIGARGIQGLYDVFQPLYPNGQIPTGRYPLGALGRMTDGRVFRYCRWGSSAGAAAPNKLYSKAATVANHQGMAITATGGAAGQNVVSGVTLGATAATVNQYADGFLFVNTGTGAGQYYQILRHAAIGSGGTGSFVLKDNIVTALDATSKINLIKHPSDSPLLQATTPLVPIGVPLVTVAAEVAATPSVQGQASYAWFQFFGPCSVLGDGAGITADSLTVVSSTVTAGAVMADNTVTATPQLCIVGYAMAAIATTQYGMVFLQIGGSA